MSPYELFKTRMDAGNCPICDIYLLDGEADFKIVNDKQYGKVWVCGRHKGV